MKSEKEIWLDPEEIKQLLEGGLYWKDIETKLSPADAEGFRRDLKKEDLSIDDIIWEPYLNIPERKPEPEEESDHIRAILLGEDPQQEESYQQEENNQKESYQQEKEENQQSDLNKVIKDRQINLDFLQMKELAIVPHAAMKEEDKIVFQEDERVFEEDAKVYKEDSEVKDDEMNAFSTITNKHFDDEEFMMELENKGNPFGGLKLIIILVSTAVITFGCWYYFLNG